jgi:2-polyprenyl-3-methyl-5-hydroxy-6-metoxy-1,4-benzoquinol methylase
MKNTSFDKETGRDKLWIQGDKELATLIDPTTMRVKNDLTLSVFCPICDCSKSSFLFLKNGFDFVRCEECGCIYVNPQIQEKLLHDYYRGNDSDRFGGLSSSALWMDVIMNEKNQSWQRPYFEEAISILKKFKKTGKILDIGCSIGLFMEIAQKHSFSCIGLELEPNAANYARSRGFDVRLNTIEQSNFPEKSFDIITMFGVLEHLSRPKLILDEIRRCLKPGGVVMVIVPNVYSLAAMTLHEKSRMFNGRNHLQYFSWKSLPEIFERTGFMVRHLDTCLTASDSILNYIQYCDPDGDSTRNFLPPKIKEMIGNPDPSMNFEQLIYHYNLGLRLRIVATKPE